MRASAWLWSVGFLVASGGAFAQSNPVAFSDGGRDRASWEAWFGSLSADAREGATWWAAHRSLRVTGSCADPTMTVSLEWRTSCSEAQRMLAPDDTRRKSEPDYRAGWNNYNPAMSPPITAAPDAGTADANAAAKQARREAAYAASAKARMDELARAASASCEPAPMQQPYPYAYRAGPYLLNNPAAYQAYQDAQNAQAAAQAETTACVARKRQAQSALDQIRQQEEQRARLAAREAQLAAENSSDNHCRDADTAGSMIDEVTSMRADKFPVVKVVDIEHITTRQWSTESTSFTCHGTFLFNNGMKIPALYTVRLNAAGRPIVTFSPD